MSRAQDSRDKSGIPYSGRAQCAHRRRRVPATFSNPCGGRSSPPSRVDGFSGQRDKSTSSHRDIHVWRWRLLRGTGARPGGPLTVLESVNDRGGGQSSLTPCLDHRNERTRLSSSKGADCLRARRPRHPVQYSQMIDSILLSLNLLGASLSSCKSRIPTTISSFHKVASEYTMVRTVGCDDQSTANRI